MFDFLRSMIISGENSEPLSLYANYFCRISTEQIVAAEAAIGYDFPNQLRALYAEVGGGCILTGSNGEISHSHNEIIPPMDVAKLMDGTCEWMLPYTKIQSGVLPFFDRDLDLFLCLRPQSENPNAVYWMYGDKICESLVEFFQKLIIDPDWFNSSKKKYI